MSAQPKATEPSMEEILASIRKIIADDQTKAPAPAAAEAAPAPVAIVAPDPEPEPKPVVSQVDDDILDLGSEAMRAEIKPIEMPAPEPLPPPAQPDEIDIMFEPAAPVEPEPYHPVPPPEPVPPVQHAPAMDMSLLSNNVSASVSNAFGSLAHTVLSQNARTVDDLVKEMLKPLLKAWLDDNLPVMVERLVRAEIERVARGGR
jgi:hypothetical protein